MVKIMIKVMVKGTVKIRDGIESRFAAFYLIELKTAFHKNVESYLLCYYERPMDVTNRRYVTHWER